MVKKVRTIWWSSTVLFVFLLVMIKNRGISENEPKDIAQSILTQADILLDGSRPCDMKVHNVQLYSRVLSDGSLGLGEAYVDGWWDVPELDQFFFKTLHANLYNQVQFSWSWLWAYIKAKVINLQSKARAFEIGERHYDLGDDLFKAMLDKRMIYSCGYWKNAHNLDEAQEHKLKLICDKLYLKPGMKVLDIGCGWGGFARYAAEHYGVQVVGVTVSKDQARYAQEYCKGLPVEIRLQDYRDIQDTFDRVVSVGMFEHVGYKNHKTYMEVAHRVLKDDGLFLLHTIGGNASTTIPDPWIEKYIFPNGLIPSIAQIGTALEGLFVMEDWHNFGADYDKTLMSWFENFDKNWPSLRDKYGDRFYRMWKYYLLSCAGAFRARSIQLWQIVLSKKGVIGGYTSIR
jgi:cyclopropane-fatty-acyl-phospholipid synthase